MHDFGCLCHLRTIFSVHRDEVERALGGEKHFNTIDATPYELSLPELGVLVPGHEPLASERLGLPTEVMAAVLGHEVLMPLEKVVHEVVDLRVVRLT